MKNNPFYTKAKDKPAGLYKPSHELYSCLYCAYYEVPRRCNLRKIDLPNPKGTRCRDRMEHDRGLPEELR